MLFTMLGVGTTFKPITTYHYIGPRALVVYPPGLRPRGGEITDVTFYLREGEGG